MYVNRFQTLEKQIQQTRNNMCATLFLLIAAICVAVVIGNMGPLDWRFGVWMLYTAIPLTLLVANAFMYTDLLWDHFEGTGRVPADDVIGAKDWDLDDLVIEPVREDDGEEED